MKNVIARYEANSKLYNSNLHSGCCFIGRNDARKLSLLPIFIFLFFGITASAQSTYTDSVYRPEIKTVEFYNTKKQASFPIIALGSAEKVLLAFDNLQGGTKNYHYTIEHCDANWNSSNLSPPEYLQNYNDDRLTDYSYSTTTVQKYTHYELKLPNENIAPKISGNYILKVYEDSDPNQLVLTRRFYVVNQKISMLAEVVASSDNSTRQTNQKINFTLDYGSLRVQNPARDIRAIVMQNARPETAILNTQPTYIRGTQLVYSDVTANDFQAGNEFRHFDTRSLKLNSERTLRITRGDTANSVILLTDPNRNQAEYTLVYDLDGSFYVLNQDGTDPRTDADYAHVYFTLQAGKGPAKGKPYIIGKFNDFKLDANSALSYNSDLGKWNTALLLKQGVYDYAYVWMDKAGKTDDTALEGSYFETENNYQLLVYYHPPGARWDELVGYRLLSSVKK